MIIHSAHYWLLALLAVAGLAPLAQAVALAAPSNCTAVTYNATATTASIDISWNDNSTTETEWYIQYSIGNGAFNLLASIPATTTASTGGYSVTWSAAALGTVYHFKILAYDGTNYSGASNVATVGTFDLNGPINLSVTAVDPFNVIMSWEEGSTAETGFAIESRTGTGPWEYLGYLNPNTLSCGPFSLINPLGTFSFRIRAFKGSAPTTPGSPAGANVSAYSNEAAVTAAAYTLTATAAPYLPTISLSWPNIQNEDGYQIWYKAEGDVAFELLKSVAANVTSDQVTVPTLASSMAYSFLIKPYAGSVYMGESSIATITVNPFTLAATTDQCQHLINLTWPDIQSEDGYQIWYKAEGETSFALLKSVAADVTSDQIPAPELDSSVTLSFIVAPYSGTTIMLESNIATLTINGTPRMTSPPGTSDVAGAAFSHTFTHVNGGAVSSHTLTGVPSTLTFNNTTGVLSGVFPALGNYTLNYTLAFTNGCSLTQTFTIRVRPPQGAPLIGTLIPAWSAAVGASRTTPLVGTFSDPEAESAVRVDTTLGVMDFILFDTATPATVTNFKDYVSTGKYSDVLFHRSMSDFVIQAGGFKATGTGTGSSFTSMVTALAVVNEPGIANLRGTVSMAKLPGDPNSATSQFFVSVADNRGTYPNGLDYQNGGFTVFGRVAGNGMAVADAINTLPQGNYTSPPADLTVDGQSAGETFSNCPMNAATAPASMDQTKLVKIHSVTSISTLSYSITGNTNPSVATADIVSGELHLLGLASGHTTITVTATDLDNLSTSQTVEVNLTDTFSTWASRNTFTGGQSGVVQNPDGDGLTNLQEYAFFGEPSVGSAGPLPATGTTGTTPATRYMTLTFPVRKFTTGLTYVVEANNQLSGAWTEVWNSASDASFSHAQVLFKVDQSDRTVVTIRDLVALATQARRFMRVKVAQN
jgi:cyclophilin family peptidyl-prolyl cis-trans isomerase